MTKRSAIYGTQPGGRGNAGTVNSFLSKEEYGKLTREQGELRTEIAAINRTINNENKATPERVARRDALLERWKEINSILHASEAARRTIRNHRARQLGATGIVELATMARELIERLMEIAGDEWTEAEGDICAGLKYIAGSQSPLLEMVHRSELDALRQKYEHEMQLSATAAQLATNQLKATIRDLQQQKGKAAQVLRDIYETRYREVDGFRIARGVTHRIHLTAEDCRKIEKVLE